MAMTELRKITADGLWHQNPALVQLLGLCPLLAVSSSVVNALGLGLVTLIVLACSNVMISLIRGHLSPALRLPIQIMVIATFVTLADLLLQTYLFGLHQRIGLFVALIVTNCVLLARAEAWASRKRPWLSVVDGFSMGLGFLLVIVTLGALRELLGHGTVFAQMELLFGPAATGMTITFADSGLLLAILPPGAFMLFGCMIAAKNWWDAKAALPSTHVTKSTNARIIAKSS